MNIHNVLFKLARFIQSQIRKQVMDEEPLCYRDETKLNFRYSITYNLMNKQTNVFFSIKKAIYPI